MDPNKEEGKEKSKSTLDKARDRAREAYNDAKRLKNAAQNIRRGAQVIRTAAQAAQAAAAAAQASAAAIGTSEFWGPLIAILAGIFLLVVLFIIIFSLLSSGGGQQNACTSIGGTCQNSVTNPTCGAGTAINPAPCPVIYDSNGINVPQICCVPKTTPLDCQTDLKGTCETGPTNCSSSTETPNQLATCADPTKPLCCVLKISNSDIVYWAGVIANNLRDLGWGFCGQPNASICNAVGYCAVTRSGYCSNQAENDTYYCTDLVIDAYNLAGIINKFSDYVPTMIDQWEARSGFSVLTENDAASVSQLKPGDVIFWMTGDFGDHVSIVSSTDVSCTQASGCYGTISILQANSNQTAATFSVINGSLISEEYNVHGQLMQPWFGLNGQ